MAHPGPVDYDRGVPTAGDAGAELYWERRGRGEPLLLIQGMSGTHLAWGEPFMSRLEADFDCVVYDNRGIGNSAEPAGPFTIAELAGDALKVMDAAGPRDRPRARHLDGRDDGAGAGARRARPPPLADPRLHLPRRPAAPR